MQSNLQLCEIVFAELLISYLVFFDTRLSKSNYYTFVPLSVLFQNITLIRFILCLFYHYTAPQIAS